MTTSARELKQGGEIKKTCLNRSVVDRDAEKLLPELKQGKKLMVAGFLLVPAGRNVKREEKKAA